MLQAESFVSNLFRCGFLEIEPRTPTVADAFSKMYLVFGELNKDRPVKIGSAGLFKRAAQVRHQRAERGGKAIGAVQCDDGINVWFMT